MAEDYFALEIDDDDEYTLAHYGIKRKSGRYPWGSGEDTETRSRDFLGTVAALRREGLSDPEIARGMALYTEDGKPWSTTDFRAATSIANAEKRSADIAMANRLRMDKGLSNVAIGKRMGIPESTVRGLLQPGAAEKADILRNTADQIRKAVDERGFIDVGSATEFQMGVSDTKRKVAVKMLQEEGYKVHYVEVPQLGTGKNTTHQIMTKEGVTYSEVLKQKGNFQQINAITEDHGRSFNLVQAPLSIDSKRVGVRYKEEGGADADGVIYVRPGVKDTSLGAANYAQVRIAVDGTHYLKGMAMYKDDLPPGVDLQFNTNKSNTGNKLDAMKPMKRDKDGNVDPDNPFGAIIRQQFDSNGKVNNVLNRVGYQTKEGSGEEGSWETWSKNLSTQFLSKQNPQLAKTQLDITYERHRDDLDAIMKLTNPAVRRKLLQSFADDADSSAVHMKAANLPRQATHVLLPVKSLKPTEVYAPNFRNGERVVLVRYPHGGKFEIPELVVNNKHQESQKLLGKQARDAIGIHPDVAKRLSGADFDGDTVLVIPNNKGQIKTEHALESLKDFDPQRDYKPYDGMRTIDGGKWSANLNRVVYPNGKDGKEGKGSGAHKQKQMGVVSNLITDMTIGGASHNELAAAVRHSMVVIDAEKHHLDYKRSAQENRISALQEKYQLHPDGSGKFGGSSTLISKAKGDIRVAKRKQGYRINPQTGAKEFTVDTRAKPYTNAKGQLVIPSSKTTRLAEAKDAHSLSSGTTIEKIYADHSNRLKALGDEARLSLVRTAPQAYSPSAKKAYDAEVKSLNAKLDVALRNAPIERQAQVLANAKVRAKQDAYPDMTKDELKKVKGQALVEARLRTGAGKTRVDITDKEWEAIQAGAVSNAKLVKILNNTDVDKVKERATPREAALMSTNKKARARNMLALGYTQADIADQLGVSVSTLKDGLKE